MKKEYILRWDLKNKQGIKEDEAHIGGDYFAYQYRMMSKRLIEKGRSKGAKGFIFVIGPRKISSFMGGLDAEFVFEDGAECHALDCDLSKLIPKELFKKG